MMMADKARTIVALGPANVARVAAYRLRLRLGRLPRHGAAIPSGRFYRPTGANPTAGRVARRQWMQQGLWFGAHAYDCGSAPDWHRNPFNGARAAGDGPWQQIADFDPALGDIKAVWEASRFDWLLAMAQRAALGDDSELDRLNGWLGDWVRANPAYRGANWKCGQEASIRILHLALAAILLDQSDDPEPPLKALIEAHLDRVRPTIGYAIAQQNNHATSEAAALFVGGSLIGALGERDSALGRRQLDRQAKRLIMNDGSFAQYSLVYHRLMLDTYCLAESWRRRRGLKPFADLTYRRLRKATEWLAQFVDPQGGDGPNMGANDGSRLMALSDCGHRDFRPTLQWASALFLDRRAIEPEGPWDQPLHWLGIDPPSLPAPRLHSQSFPDGGIHVLRSGRTTAYLRFPAFRFRPSQADSLHFDLWHDGANLLRDGGSYSYAAGETEQRQFGGAPGHNLIEFDGRDQMPRIGRFLYARWLKAEAVEEVAEHDGAVSAAAAYRDRWGAFHHRRVEVRDGMMICTDRIGGKAERAVLRWRLAPGDWRVDDGRVTDGRTMIAIEGADGPPVLVSGWESRHYLEKSPIPVIEAALRVPAVVTTRMTFD